MIGHGGGVNAWYGWSGAGKRDSNFGWTGRRMEISSYFTMFLIALTRADAAVGARMRFLQADGDGEMNTVDDGRG
jgi:hypothetical protein